MKIILFLTMLICSLQVKSQTQCNAAFTYTITNNMVSFSSDSLGNGGSSLWYFGDGSDGWNSYTIHSYNAPGSYTIKHIVNDSVNNCKDSSTQIINLSFTPGCNAFFQYFGDSTNLARYYFSDASTIIGSSYKSFEWTIDNTIVSNDSWLSYVFPHTGTYHVCEQLQTYSGCVSTSCKDISITSIDSCALKASFTYTQDSSNRLAIKFTALPDTGNNLNYYWSFGDGTSGSNEKNPVHVYSKGSYYASLFVNIGDSNSLHCSAFYSQLVYVNIGPADTCAVSFTYTADSGKPNVISFTAISGQPLASQTWYIVNGNNWYPYDSTSAPEFVLEKNNPTFTFPDTGAYYVSLKVTTQAGCVAYSDTYNMQFIHIDSIANNAVVSDNPQQVPAYPNPATNNVNLNLALVANNSITINIFTSMGNLILTKQITGNAGNNQIAIPVQTLQPGVYYMEINYGNTTKRSRFQKL